MAPEGSAPSLAGDALCTDATLDSVSEDLKLFQRVKKTLLPRAQLQLLSVDSWL